MSDGTLRRAAILIASLDTASADALLNEMSAEQAALIRSAVMELGDIDVIEQEEIVGQFVGVPPLTVPPLTTEPDIDGVEIDADLAGKFTTTPKASETLEPVAEMPLPQPDLQPFAFLDEVRSEELARALSGEHPQAIAIVTAHLPPARAAEVIEYLPQQQQTDTLMRIARLTAPHPDVIRDLENEMMALLVDKRSSEQVGTEGLARVEAILQNTSQTARQSLVASLSLQDRALVSDLHAASDIQPPAAAPASALHSPDQSLVDSQRWDPTVASEYTTDDRLASSRWTLEFSDLEQLDSAELAKVLQRCSSNTTLLALAGASHQFVKQILSQLPTREAAQLERKIQQIGPLRLDDVHRAQQQLASIAEQLAAEGLLIVPGKQRLSVAA